MRGLGCTSQPPTTSALATRIPHAAPVPRATALAVIAVCVVALWMLTSVALAIGVLGGLAALWSARTVWARRHVRRASRGRRERARRRRLRGSCQCHRQMYLDLHSLIDKNLEDAVADRLELEDMLDRFVRLAAAHRQWRELLARSVATDVIVAGSVARSTIGHENGAVSTRARELRERRVRHRQECLKRADQLADDLDTISELVCLVVERAARPALMDDDLDGEVARRLWELDEVNAALARLSAGTGLDAVDGSEAGAPTPTS